MKKLILSFIYLLLSAGFAMQSGSAFSQATRTWVSGVGDDVNPCSRTAPCKTFAGAISKTAAGGIINCLDSGGFGAVTITKSITIDCTGVIAGVLASGTNGINVNANATDVVTLRGLDIEGAGITPGSIGVNFINGGVLHIENCRIYGFQSGSAIGVLFAPPAGNLFMTDTQVADNGTAVGGGGIVVHPNGGSVRALIRRVGASNNYNGIVSDATSSGSARVQIVDTVAAGNRNAGIVAQGNGALAFMDRASTLHNAGAGAMANGSGSFLIVTNSTIADNGTGVSVINGGFAYSYVTNHINANTGPDGTPLSGTLNQN